MPKNLAMWLGYSVCMLTCACGSTPTSPGPGGSAGNGVGYSVTGQVGDPVGRPVAGARVEIIEGPSVGAVATTTADGRFVIPVPPYESPWVRINVSREGYLPATARWRLPDSGALILTPDRLLDMAGSYALTFTADAACTQLPAAYRSRTFNATIAGDARLATRFIGQFTDSGMMPFYNRFSGNVAGDSVRVFVYSEDAQQAWLEDEPIVELIDGTTLAFMGTARSSGLADSNSITADFDGTISYCAAPVAPAKPDFPPTCSAEVKCGSHHHLLTMTRR